MDGQGAPWWAVGGLFTMWAVRELWAAIRERRVKRTETDANIELIEALRAGLDRQGQRISAMEAAHSRIATRLDEEIKLRMEAQEEAHRLKLRVQTLESEMRRLGVVIPPDHTMRAEA